MQSLRGLRGPAGGCWAILGPQLRRHQFRLQETRRSGNASTPRCSLRPSQLKYTCQIAQQGPCRASAPPSSSPEADSDAQEGVADVLGSFLYWLVANGVEGVGREDSRLALFEDAASGERGLVATADVAAGEVLLLVPLDLALTDYPGDEQSNALLYEGAPWGVRLAAKLLRERSKGPSSPWAPYLAALPRSVPCPSQTFAWDEIQAVQYRPAQAALHEYDYLVSDGYRSCSPEALGGASAADFRWAMAVVHSRTFATAAPGGGVGVRMLVPLVDMLNHGGDVVASGLLADAAKDANDAATPGSSSSGLSESSPYSAGGSAGPAVIATDHVRWDLLPPPPAATAVAGTAGDGSAGGGGGWRLAVKAVRDVRAGEQVLLSYGERNNDDFMVHYGFVPPPNPHDDAVLFESLEEALDWHYEQYDSPATAATATATATAGGPMSEAQALEAYQAALAVGQAEQAAEEEAVVAAAQLDAASSSTSSGGSGDATTSSGGGGDAKDEKALQQMRRPKVVAGSRVSGSLVAAFAAVRDRGTRHAELAVASRCWQLLDEMGTTLLHDLALLAAEEAAQAAESESGDYWGRVLQHYHRVLRQRFAGVPAPAGVAATPLSLKPPTSVQLVQLYLLDGTTGAPSSALGGAASGSLQRRLTQQLSLAVSYRAYKKMIMWDFVLATGAALKDLSNAAVTSG